ncbi:MAG TPA: biotin/lipoyl-binding protein [Gammaproteobacteria bacterium]|nr:biotin/lipoyl-binding protein [Gammaproteobacteria bacterium]
MSESFFSPDWPGIAELTPRLRPHLKLHRQVYRNRVWHIVEDEVTGRHHRLDALAYELASRLDGQTSINALWEQLLDQLGEKAPSQHDIIQLIGGLHQADLIQATMTPDSEELFYRREKRNRQQRQSLVNPFAFKARLFNPTRLLDWLEPLTGWAFHGVSALLLALLVIPAGVLALQHWPEIQATAAARLPSGRFWMLVWFVYPLVKLCHELGHALAVRHWGGQVQEIGVSLLALMPVPYVNASAANLFPQKHARMIVSAAGILVEVAFSAIAFLVWLNVSDGLARDLAFVVMTISGLSTVLFNANPLIRFDGYHFLADWLEIPDLARRSTRYWIALAKRFLLQTPRASDLDLAPGEAKWLAIYGPASWLYRWLILAVIVAWMAKISRALAIAVALYFLFILLIRPAWRIARYLWASRELSNRRLRALATVTVGLLAATAAVALLPAPFATLTQGVVRAPDESRVRATADGFVTEVLVEQGAAVEPGQALVRLRNDLLHTRQRQLEARLAATDIRLQAARQDDPARARQLEKERASVRSELDRLREQTGDLVIRASIPGRLFIPRLSDLPGRFLHKGDTLGYVLGESALRLRAAIPQADAEKLARYPGQITFRTEQRPARQARLLSVRPAGSNRLPSPALAARNGGAFLTDPGDEKALKTLNPVFIVDLAAPELTVDHIGNRVWLRFDHGRKPLLQQWAIRWEQLLLKHFSGQA